mmetsp:Transcript_12037/g.21877  ORF Transcript_12037/g.21877 Transcript_12037/m.21877 type:complete len:115 (+) Transcript_12037:881-1225(+)
MFVSVWSMKGSLVYCPFGRKWACFGLFIGVLCLVDFAADIARFVSWRTFEKVALTISIFNSVLFIPLWLLELARQLPKARAGTEDLFRDQDNSTEDPPTDEYGNVVQIEAREVD